MYNNQKDIITNFTGSFDRWELLIVESLFIVMILGVSLSYSNFSKNKLFTKAAFTLGGITYPLYLLHWKIGVTIITHYTEKYGSVTLFSFLFALLLIIFSYILSIYDARMRKFLKERLFTRM